MVGPRNDFMKDVHQLKIKLQRSETGRSNQNYATEREIGELKKRWRNRMLKRQVSPRLWDYGLIYETNILNRIPRSHQQRTGIEMSPVRHQTSQSGSTLSFTIEFGSTTKRRLKSMAAVVASHVGLELSIGSVATFVTGCC